MKRRKVNTVAGIAITATIVYGTVSLILSLDQLREAERSHAELKAEIEAVRDENSELSRAIGEIDSDCAKERLAQERLGLVKPGEIIFINQHSGS